MIKKFFLEEVVDYTFRKYDDIRNLKIIFPNRRAGLYFQKALSKKTNKAMWSPKVLTMEEFVQGYVDIKISDEVSDNILLNHYLFQITQKYQDKDLLNSFEKFYYWGQILINDFDDIDQSLKDESKIFKSIKDQKEIDETFQFLDKENFESIKSFWKKFFPKMSSNQKSFHETWKILLKIYREFKKTLIKNKIAYKGLVYKEFLQSISSLDINKKNKYLFVGFSSLTNAEKEIIKYFIKKYSSMAFWDFDRYYYNDIDQEAGDSFREFSEDNILNSTFPDSIPNNFEEVEKKLYSIGVGSQVGQAKILGNILLKKSREINFDQDKVLVLLPNENLLFPVLNTIPDSINNINVTMGFPLSETPLFNMIHLIVKVHKNSFKRDLQTCNYFKDILELISHPYIYQYDKQGSNSLISDLNDRKIIYVSHKYLSEFSEILKYIFDSKSSLLEILKNVSSLIYNNSNELGKLDKEYIRLFLDIIDRIENINIDFKSFEVLSKLLTQILKITKIPFSGEPLSGLQIMGVLESRNLDFDDVYILNMNEGEFPKNKLNISFIPFNIRKAFNLKTIDVMDRVYSYLFYRVIQRAKNITFIYNKNADFNSKGEISRYINQLNNESNYQVKDLSVTDKIGIVNHSKLIIPKTNNLLDKIRKRFYDDGYLSPSGVKDYMDCSLRFYYKYLANIKQLAPYSENIGKPEFGKITHNALELVYNDVLNNKQENVIEKNDFLKIKAGISGSISKVIKKHFRLNNKNEFIPEGNNIILIEIIKDYMSKVISFDEKYAPFKILNLEGDKKSGFIKKYNLSKKNKVNISGFIDRIDEKNNKIRIIDYKTGGDSRITKDVKSLFSKDKKERNDALFQLLFYSLLVKNSRDKCLSITPGLINIRQVKNKISDIRIIINKKKIDNVLPLLDEFEKHLKGKINEIFDDKIPFTQNDDKEECKYCPYKNMCST